MVFCTFAPNALHACSCVGQPQSVREHFRRHAAVFVGTAVDEIHSLRNRSAPVYSVFVVEKRWKGAAGDTVLVIGANGVCGPHIAPGHTYLVFAHETSTGLWFRSCEMPSPVIDTDWYWKATAQYRRWVQAVIDSLGPATSTSPPAGRRTIDRAPAPEYRGPPIELLLLLRPDSFKRGRRPEVELLGTGQRVIMDRHGSFQFFNLEPRFYRARLYLPDGSSEDHYVRPRCNQRPESGCHYGRSIYPKGRRNPP